MLNKIKTTINYMTGKSVLECDPWEELARENELYYTYNKREESNIITYENESDIFDDDLEDWE